MLLAEALSEELLCENFNVRAASWESFFVRTSSWRLLCDRELCLWSFWDFFDKKLCLQRSAFFAEVSLLKAVVNASLLYTALSSWSVGLWLGQSHVRVPECRGDDVVHWWEIIRMNTKIYIINEMILMNECWAKLSSIYTQKVWHWSCCLPLLWRC